MQTAPLIFSQGVGSVYRMTIPGNRARVGWLVIALVWLTGRVACSQDKPTLSDAPHEQVVDIGYHKLFSSWTGPAEAKFTVVFESGAGGGANDWKAVRSYLPTTVRTIAYDRAGTRKSEAGPLPRTMAQEVFELHQLLEKANIKGPLILVGQSIGGLLVRLYTARYGKEVAGLVLVDPTHESSVLGSMKYGGWVRLREKAVGKLIPKPQLDAKLSPGYDSTADYMAEEFQKIYLDRLKKPQSLADRPLVILGAGKGKQPPGTPDEQWKEILTEKQQQKRDLTTLSRNSTFILDTQSGHMIHYDNPKRVAEAVELVIEAIQSNKKL